MNIAITAAEPVVEKVELARCRFGHDHPIANVNSRRSHRDASKSAMCRSLLEKGQLQPGRAFPAEDDSGDVWVFIGNRRLLGLKENAAAHMAAPQTMELIVDRAITPKQALELSLEENEQREALHPIDRYEDYAELKKLGVPAAEIGARHGVAERTVQQYLALGDLSAKIREAWRAGEVDDAAARAFTLTKDVKAQDRLFARLQKVNQLSARRVRDELVPGEHDPRYLNYVGLTAYQDAGGVVMVDLFDDRHGVSDAPLARELARRKLEADAARIAADEHWSWAADAETLPKSWPGWAQSEVKAQYSGDEKLRRGVLEAALQKIEDENDAFASAEESDHYDRLRAEYEGIEQLAKRRAFTDRARKKAGVALWIGEGGRLERRDGMIRPPQEDAAKVLPEKAAKGAKALDPGLAPPAGKSAPAATPSADEPAAPAISAAHARTLEMTFVEGVGVALGADPRLTLAMLIADQAAGSGLFELDCGDGKHLTNAKTFAAALAVFGKMKDAALLKLLPEIVACRQISPGSDDKNGAALLAAIQPRHLSAALRKRHNWGEDFERRPKPLLLEAVAEAFGKDEAARVGSLPRDKLTAWCKVNIPPTGWLPPELRFPGFALPGAKKPAATKPAAKTSAPKKAVKKKGKR